MPKSEKHLKTGKKAAAETLSEKETKEKAEERFRLFFSTTVVDIPAEMARHDAEAAKPKRGLFAWILRHLKRRTEPEKSAEPAPQVLPTGEISLTAVPVEPQANLELAWEPVEEEEPTPDACAENTSPAPEPESSPAEEKQGTEPARKLKMPEQPPENSESAAEPSSAQTAPEAPEQVPEHGKEAAEQPPEASPENPEANEEPAQTEATPAVSEEKPEQPAESPEASEDSETANAAESPEVPDAQEVADDRLRRMSAALTLRCVLSGILAVVLLHFGLVAEGLMPPSATLDPALAPAAFYAANLLLYAAALCVAYPVLRDGLGGLRRSHRASADTLPALAACGALLEAAIALLNANSYQNSSFTLLTGIAALGLFLALLGSRVMLTAVRECWELAVREDNPCGAYRVRDKDLIRSLSANLVQKDPWILQSSPTEWNEQLMEQCFGERASERRTRKTAYILLGVAVFSGLVFLLFGGGVNGAAAAMTAVLCMGAPLSSTLIAGISALRLQRSAAVIGAAVPGWAAVEELGGIDTLLVNSDDLFAPDSVALEDIHVFKGGRIDRVILYAASVLNQGCETLRKLFARVIEEHTEILYPVKDFEVHDRLGFSAWCDNNRVLIGNRAYMMQEGVELPEKSLEKKYSKEGTLQILYLAVSGTLHAMFILRYTGGRHVAQGMNILHKENMRLLVHCQDPSLTAKHITEIYHLPEGMVTLLNADQCKALRTAAATQEALAADAPTAKKKTCCMVFQQGFVSLTGGVRAAEQAQNAEGTATAVQLVSVWVSVAIAILLTYAGSVGFLSVMAVLMYQAAWSGLSIAVCALKQHER